MLWNFEQSDYKEGGNFALIPAEKFRCRIEVAEETTSKAGKPMIKLILSVSGYESRIWDYIVLDDSSIEARQRTNQKLGSIYNSFDIPMGNMDIKSWQGKTGAIKVKHDTYNGEKSAKVHYYLSKKEQVNLPPWKENGGTVSQTSTSAGIPFDPDEMLI